MRVAEGRCAGSFKMLRGWAVCWGYLQRGVTKVGRLLLDGALSTEHLDHCWGGGRARKGSIECFTCREGKATAAK
jgi:hypothetical protein